MVAFIGGFGVAVTDVSDVSATGIVLPLPELLIYPPTTVRREISFGHSMHPTYATLFPREGAYTWTELTS